MVSVMCLVDWVGKVGRWHGGGWYPQVQNPLHFVRGEGSQTDDRSCI